MKPILEIIKNNHQKRKPIWFMRQAGRYLPEYMKVRENAGSFLDLCYNPKLAAEVTLQPTRRFDIDAAIIFSDILVIPHALGLNVGFEKNEGPRVETLEKLEDLKKLSFNNFEKTLSPVYEALDIVKEKLNPNLGLIGFSGGAWTLATYTIEGKTSKDFQKSKMHAFTESEFFNKLIDILVEAISLHIKNQIKAGAEIIQIFDSWSAVLPEEYFKKYVIEPTKKIVENVKSEYPNTPIIGFPKGAGLNYKEYSEGAGVDAVSFDSQIHLKWFENNIKIPTQGNIDPIMLLTNEKVLKKQIENLIGYFGNRSHIYNLGHGIVPSVNPDMVEYFIKIVREHE